MQRRATRLMRGPAGVLLGKKPQVFRTNRGSPAL